MTTQETTRARTILKGRVLSQAMSLFAAHGVRHVKMDDIAKALAISKRTLYEVYADKATLLFDVVTTRENEREEHMRQFAEAHPDTIDVVIEFYRLNTQELSDVNPQFFEDVHKYPAITRYLDAKHAARHKATAAFINRAVQEGYFRQDVNYDIFRHIGEAASRAFMDARLYHKYPLGELFRTLIMVLMRGICTEKGTRAIDKHLKMN